MSQVRQFFRFALVGVVGFVVDAAVLYLGLQIGLGYFGGRAVSFFCAVLTTWLINRQFTFAEKANLGLATEVLRYFLAMLVGGAVNYATYSAVVIEFSHLPMLPLIAVAAGSVAGLFFNFFAARLWVFNNKKI
jgi:putative flippase GtrA